MNFIKHILVLYVLLSGCFGYLQKKIFFYPGNLWLDNNEKIINAHGGGILYHAGKYYWFGEHKGKTPMLH